MGNDVKLRNDLSTTGEWYLTVRCKNAVCTRLIAFQKAIYRPPPSLLPLLSPLALSYMCISHTLELYGCSASKVNPRQSFKSTTCHHR